MRFGDSRVQALAGALCVTVGAVTGITNRSLRALMTGLLGTTYGITQSILWWWVETVDLDVGWWWA